MRIRELGGGGGGFQGLHSSSFRNSNLLSLCLTVYLCLFLSRPILLPPFSLPQFTPVWQNLWAGKHFQLIDLTK